MADARPHDKDTGALYTATQAYQASLTMLQDEESALAALQRRQEAGERLTRDEQLDKLTLQDSVEQLRHEVEAAQPAMEAEQLALDIADVVEAWNEWTVPQQQAFEMFVNAISAVYAAKEQFVRVHDEEGKSLANMPQMARVKLQVPTGMDALHNFVSGLPQAHGWMTALMGPEALTVGHVKNLRANHKAAQVRDVQHVTNEIQRRRRIA